MDMMEKLKMEMIDRVKEIAHSLLKNKGIELLDVTYRREGSVMVLRITVDKKGPLGHEAGKKRAGGITVDECAWISDELGKLLDKENFLIETYTLEVCSPGLDRLLKTRKDFEKVKGQLVRVHTYVPLEDKKEHIGKVVSCDDEHVMIELKDQGTTRKIPLGHISKAQIEIEF